MKSSFSSAFLSKMRSKIFSWKDPTNQGEKLIEVFVEGKTWYSNVLRRFRLDVNLCTSILEVSIRLMSWLVRFRISFMRRFSSTVRAERELSLWLIQWSAHLQKRWGHPGHFWDLKKCSSEFLDVCKTCLISESVQIEVGHLHDSGKAPKYNFQAVCSFFILDFAESPESSSFHKVKRSKHVC